MNERKKKRRSSPLAFTNPQMSFQLRWQNLLVVSLRLSPFDLFIYLFISLSGGQDESDSKLKTQKSTPLDSDGMTPQTNYFSRFNACSLLFLP